RAGACGPRARRRERQSCVLLSSRFHRNLLSETSSVMVDDVIRGIKGDGPTADRTSGCTSAGPCLARSSVGTVGFAACVDQACTGVAVVLGAALIVAPEPVSRWEGPGNQRLPVGDSRRTGGVDQRRRRCPRRSAQRRAISRKESARSPSPTRSPTTLEVS